MFVFAMLSAGCFQWRGRHKHKTGNCFFWGQWCCQSWWASV